VIPIVHHPDYVAHAPAGSRYRWGKNGLVRDLLRERGSAIDWHDGLHMPRDWIEAVHDDDYVAEVIEARVPAHKERRIGFAVTPAMALRAQAVPGGTWVAARVAMERGYAANTAGGSHHALADTGAGYCVFNDLAIAANRLVVEGTCDRVLVIDVDVHQGDGTASMLAGRPGLATYSIHADKNFPARKACSTLDVPLRDGVEDDEYLTTLEATLVPLIDSFAPSLLLYQAGVDPFAGDRLGRLALTEAGLNERDRWIGQLARKRGLPIASALGGGYGDLLEVAARHVASIVAVAQGTGIAPGA
jgi:acetoin utilization deacetylase AcuC-like enzyme